jgi:competence protein ComEC
MTLLNLPFIKLTIPFVIGIIFELIFPILGPFYLTLLILIIGIFFLLVRFKSSLGIHRYTGLSMLVFMFCLGGLLTYNANPRNHKFNLETAGLHGHYLLEAKDPPQEKSKSYKIICKALFKIGVKNKKIPINEKVIIYLSKQMDMPQPGDRFMVKCHFKGFADPENPFQFNYKKYLKWQGIHYQAKVNKPEYLHLLSSNSYSFSKHISYKGIQYLRKLFNEQIKDKRALAVVEALIFGYKDDLPKALIDAYAHTGTLHVLAVSGLHVAIVFLLLSKALWFLNKGKFGLWTKTIVVILFIWAYCILTGMSPSILRAGIMISVYLVGKALDRQVYIFNTIGFTACFILALDPLSIMNVGFQLSFLAVIGIVYLQDYLMPIWRPNHWFLKQIWSLLVISFCAQLATFPLTLFYFNQFPNYFLLSNLVIIPISTLILYSGIGMVLVSHFNIGLYIFSRLTENLVEFLNRMVLLFEKLPFAYTDGIKFNLMQVILLYICIGILILWLINKNRRNLMFSLVCLIWIVAISVIDTIKMQSKKRVVFFNVPNQKAILISNGRKSLILLDSLSEQKKLVYTRGWLIQHRLWPITYTLNLSKINQCYFYNSDMKLCINNGNVIFNGEKIKLIKN